MGAGTAANTHVMFNTVGHQHLDSLVYWATGDFPGEGLNLVECADGRWFVEVDHGEGFNAFEGVSRPNVAPYAEPRFFADEMGARAFAIECIQKRYPDLQKRDLNEWFED
jgi:hypothetical protein